MIVTKSIVDFILLNYSQIHLFAKYFGLSVEQINYCLISKTNTINNPLRVDHNPSLGFMYKNNGKLISKDWAYDIFTGDIFDLVGLIYKLDSRKDLIKIAKIIIDNNELNKEINKEVIIQNINKTIIKFKAIKFNNFDINYWKNGGVNISHLHYRKVYSAGMIWINNMNNPIYTKELTNPAYIYILSLSNKDVEIKTYNPFAKNKKDKFKTNGSKIFESINELYDANILVIAKSRKDKLVIESNLIVNNEYLCDSNLIRGDKKEDGQLSSSLYWQPLNNDDYNTYCITSFNTESNRIKLKLANYLRSKYNNIILYLDYDKAGVMNGFYHKVLYNFIPKFLGRNIDLYNEFTRDDIIRFLSTITVQNSNVKVTVEMFKQFIEDNKNNYISKDLFEYFTNNGNNKGEVLVNNMFKI